MKTTTLIMGMILLFLVFLGIACEKDEQLPPNQAKGKIIAVTARCYGEIIVIEVENPEGIGVEGTFTLIGEETNGITYKNAIGVPYFEKTGISATVPQAVGTWLYFEYRELTEEEEKGNLFNTEDPLICLMNIGPPTVKRVIITKIIDFN